jgi:uncharacterized protein YndB with AHSA1/START domain
MRTTPETKEATRGAGPRLEIRRNFESTPARLFAAWTTAQSLTQWHAPGELTVTLAEVDLRVGGRYRIHMQEPGGGATHKVSGSYHVIEPPRKLVYTWQWEGDPVETEVTLEFIPRGTGTEMVLIQTGFADDAARGHHEKGWTAIMERLARHY